MRSVMCISRTILSSQIMLLIIWFSCVLYMMYGSDQESFAKALNLTFNAINIFIFVPLNFSIYLMFWAMVTRMRKLFKVLQKKKVLFVMYTVLFMSLAMLLSSEVSLTLEAYYVIKGWNAADNVFMFYFFYPALRSMNIINDCMQTLTVLFVIKHVSDLRK